MEKAQLERLADVDATRPAMLNALKASAAAQVKDHYARLRAQKQRWAEKCGGGGREEGGGGRRSARARTRRRRCGWRASSRGGAASSTTSRSCSRARRVARGAQAAYTAQAVETAEREIDATDTRSQQALYNLGAHVARGEKEDAQRLSEILVASEGRMQSETLAQQAAATEPGREEKERHDAICVQLGQQHPSCATATAEAAEAAARDVADRTQALLKEAHAARNAARERTRESGLALAASLGAARQGAREVLRPHGARRRRTRCCSSAGVGSATSCWSSFGTAPKRSTRRRSRRCARVLASEAEECAKMREGERSSSARAGR